VHFLGWVERPIYRALGTSPEHEQTWKRYAGSLIIFSGVSLGLTYLIFRIQGSLPLNPQHLGAVPPALSFNTAVSFLTNTNWQNYGGETTMSYFSQMALVVQQFVSPAVGIVAALVLVRGFSRRNSAMIGNFWVDLTRCLFYILLPIAFIAGIIFVGQGAVETLAGTVSIRDALNGVTQTIARGPIGFMEPIKQLGTNGGGFLDQNGSTPFENPTALTNWLSIYLILSIPFALTYTFGKMVGSIRHGATLLVAMLVIFGSFLAFTSYAEHQGNPAVAAAGIVSQPTGNMEGKEVRFGDTATALYGVTSTQTSTGSADASYDSFNPIGGFGLIGGMMMGEVSPGGTGTGLYTILLMAIIAVFIGGLMIGRTPEYLGKRIQATEIKLAGLGVLVMPLIVLILTGIAVSVHAGRIGPLNAGPHGFTEILYAFVSQANNNGSAFGGLTGNTAFYNIAGGIDMLVGRFGVLIPALALGGALAAKQVVPAGLGTFRTDNTMFVGLVVGVIVVVGGLTFFPALALGPIVEQLSHGKFF
jgi:K+-transporting ATPase ATPase A chain